MNAIRRKILIYIIFFLVFSLILWGATKIFDSSGSDLESSGKNPNHSTEEDGLRDSLNSESSLPGNGNLISQNPGEHKSETKAVIAGMGDVILHDTVIAGGLHSEDGYNFDHIFAYIKDIVGKKDFLTLNYEGTIGCPPYRGYPLFGAPVEIVSSIKFIGTDLVNLANNHLYDRGISGIISTVQSFKNAGIPVVGARENSSDPGYHIIDINGIKTGFSGYTFETTGSSQNMSINGIKVEKDAESLIDSFNDYYLPEIVEEDKMKMISRVEKMKEEGAELIVFHVHWGEEYKTSSNKRQQNLARILADAGVDIIFGHHPHVLQEISVLKSTDIKSGKEKNTLVYYSLGNSVANMDYATHGTKGNAEDGLIASVSVERNSSGEVRITEGRYIKTYIWKDERSGRLIHRIVPVKEGLKNPEKYGIDEAVIKLLQDSNSRIDRVLRNSNVSPDTSSDKRTISIGEE